MLNIISFGGGVLDEFSAGSAPFHAGYGADFIVPDSFLFLFAFILLGLEDDVQDIFDSTLGYSRHDSRKCGGDNCCKRNYS